MKTTTSVIIKTEKLYEILSSMNYDINQSQCFDVVNEIDKNQANEGKTRLKGRCLDVISMLDGYDNWNAYNGDVSVNLNRVEQFVDDMMEGDTESSYEKFTQHREKMYLVNYTEKKFLRDVREIQENYGDYINRQFLGCLAGDTDPEVAAKYPHELRYLWRFVFEKKEVLGVACIYFKNGTYHVSGFNYY